MMENYELFGYIAMRMNQVEDQNVDYDEVFNIISFYEEYKKKLEIAEYDKAGNPID